MADEIIAPVDISATPAPHGGVLVTIQLPCTPVLVIELPADEAQRLMRGIDAALGSGFERTAGGRKAEAAHVG